MARTKGTANFSGTIEPLAGGALDARDVVQTKADLTASGSFPYPYIGMETYVVAENKKYRLVGADPTNIDNWQEAIPEVDVDDALSDTSENPVQNKVIKGAIDDVTDSIGDLADLDTTEKGSIVGAINEVKDFDNLDNRPVKDVTPMSDIITPLPGTEVKRMKYSTEEQVVGEWIDGKPLYQKTITGTLPTVTTDYTDADSFYQIGESVERGVIVNAVFISVGNPNQNWDIPYVKQTGSSGEVTSVLSSVINNSDSSHPNSLRVLSNRISFSDAIFFITIQYTKTTDTV